MEFTLNGSLSELSLMASETGRFCQENSLGQDVEFDLNLILEEMFMNVIRHGGCAGMADAARVRLSIAPDGVAVDFEDRGTTFDPAEAPPLDLAATLSERQAGGLGIHLVRQLLPDLQYEHADGWNRTTGTRRWDSA